MKRKQWIVCVVFLINIPVVFAQKTSSLILTADSLASGNYKDVFSSFFQLAVNRITSPDKEIRFMSNPFAVMARRNPDLLVDTNYYKYTHLRNLNFSFAARLDTSFKFNGFTSGIKYAIVNRRDETVSRAFLISVADDFRTSELPALNNSLEAYISTLTGDPENQKKVREQKTKFFSGEINFNQVDIFLQEKIKQIAQNNNAVHLLSLLQADKKFNIKKYSQLIYDSLKTLFNNKLLWTAGINDTTYRDQFFFSNLVIFSDLVKGIADPSANNNVELNLRSSLQYTDDTYKSGRDLKRSVFSFEPGLNLVMKVKGTGQSFLEYKLSGSYHHTFSNLYKGEKRNRLMVNSMLRIRVINDIWIPLEIRYDPVSGNVFGFLNVRANFNTLAGMLM